MRTNPKHSTSRGPHGAEVSRSPPTGTERARTTTQPLPLRRAGDRDAPDEVGDEVGKGVDQAEEIADHGAGDGESAAVRSPDPDPHEELAEGCTHRRVRQGHVREPSE